MGGSERDGEGARDRLSHPADCIGDHAGHCDHSWSQSGSETARLTRVRSAGNVLVAMNHDEGCVEQVQVVAHYVRSSLRPLQSSDDLGC